MNENEIELHFYRILCGKLYFYFKNEKYELRTPSSLLRYEGNLLYNHIIGDEKYTEWIREEDLIPIMINLGLWDKDSLSMITYLEKQIDNTKIEFYLNFLFSDAKKKIHKVLQSLKSQLNGILSSKAEFFVNSVEGYASAIKNEFLICNTLYKDNSRIFESQYNDQVSYTQFNELVSEINKYTISMDTFKTIARSNLWRSYWNANKINVFDGAVINWTDDQRTLVNITKMYDSVYEHPECPDDKIIENEDALDGWILHQRKQIEKQKKEQIIDNLNPKLKNAQEVFLMSNSQESFDNIMELNSSESKKKLKSKLAHVDKHGATQEFDLPDVKIDIMNRANTTFKK